MNTPKAFVDVTVAKFEKRIDELEAQLPAIGHKWIVVCGGLPIDFESPVHPWSNLEQATKWASPQFARANAVKVRNGLGEVGVAKMVAHYIMDEVLELKRLIKSLKLA